MEPFMTASVPALPSLREALPVWGRIAALSFGGPAGQIALMHRILVAEKRWIGETRFLHALNYCMLLPGPEAHQLAVYIGWLMHKTRGGLVAGGLFVLPGLISLGLLSAAYAVYGKIGFVAALFFGLKAAVLAIVLEALVRIGRRALKTRAQIAVAALAFVGIFLFALPFPLIIFLAALIGWGGERLGLSWFKPAGHAAQAGAEAQPALIDEVFARGIPDHAKPSFSRLVWVGLISLTVWFAPLLLALILWGPGNVFVAIAAFNAKMAVLTFGGAYAVLAYMAQQAVDIYHWLKPDEMLVGLGLAETTPGPLISVVQFIGFIAAFRQPGALSPLWAGTLGGVLAMWMTFVPSFLWIFLGAPYIEALIGNKALHAALSSITAAVVGVILNLAVWFALHTLFGEVAGMRAFGAGLNLPVLSSLNWQSFSIALGAMLAIFRFGVGMIPVLAASCLAGLALHFVFPTPA
jgi:chromate transporter